MIARPGRSLLNTEQHQTTIAGGHGVANQSDLFIVDNSDEHWKALEYVRQWCEISSAIDIATGHFELGAFLALDAEWQKVDKIRLLIGGETSPQTAAVIAAALDRSIEVERATGDPFLSGASAVVDAIRNGKIEIRTYRRKKFHAKGYITHGRLEVVGSAALVGSSNFTRPGLTQNVELNVRFTGPEVRDLQAWYEAHWNDADPIAPELLKVLEYNVREFSPFEVYMKALQALTGETDEPDISWEQSESKIYKLLAPYQREAYHGLRRMADAWSGGFLTDGVGLGKTFVGLMLAEYYAVRRRQNVLIMATKTGQDAVWEPELRRRLPNLFGEFTNVKVLAHTDLSRADAPALVEQLHERVDVVIIDEAHNFRNHGRKGDDVSAPRSRWWRLQEICAGKLVFNLTATPINNSLFDLVHQIELFSGMGDDYFKPIGVNSLQRYIAELEKPFRIGAGRPAGSPIDLTDFETLLREDRLLESVIWQNSRKYAIASTKVTGAGTVLFPEQQIPQVVTYDLGLYYSKLLTELDAAFQRAAPLFTLPMYYPLAFSKDPDVNTIAENRQRQVVALIRTTFLKRFESSIAAFAGSCIDLAGKILLWLEVNTRGDQTAEKRLADWRKLHDPLLDTVHLRYRPAGPPPSETTDLTDDELDELELDLDPDVYKLDEMIDAAFEDLTQLQRLLERIADTSGIDDKYSQLFALLTGKAPSAKKLDPTIYTPEFREQKVIVFTEFADTARYLADRLKEDGVAQVDRLDGSTGGNRFAMIKRFAPFYNRVTPAEQNDLIPLRVLVSTDVLSEGVNLQDGTLLVNYDLHWNPVRLMQRIGRVDRRMDPGVEAAIVKANPKTKATRGKIQVRNFLPPDDIETLLRLHQRVQSKVLRISKTLGIPGGKLLSPKDMLDDVKVFQAFVEEYEGDLSPVEQLRLHYLSLVAEDPTLEERVSNLPNGISTARSGTPGGVFLCRIYPTLTRAETGDEEDWSLTPGRVEWSLDVDGVSSETGLLSIDAAIRSDSATTRSTFSDITALRERLRRLERDRDKRYRKDVQLPLDAPAPRTICWMEVR